MDLLIEFLKNIGALNLFIIALVVGITATIVSYIFLTKENKPIPGALMTGYGSSWWPLVSGGASNNYFDLDKFLSDPSNKNLALDAYTGLIDEAIEKFGHIDLLAFILREVGPVGALPLKELLVSRTGIPAVIVRTQKRLTKAAIKGADLYRGQKVLIIGDVATTGRGLIRVKKKLVKFGVEIPAALVFLARKNKAAIKAVLDGTEIISFITMENLERMLGQLAIEKKRQQLKKHVKDKSRSKIIIKFLEKKVEDGFTPDKIEDKIEEILKSDPQKSKIEEIIEL